MIQAASAILMIRPAAFGFNAETAVNNTFQSAIKGMDALQAQNKAQKEFDDFVKTLSANHIEVLVIEDTPDPIKPDAIFPNNWFCTLPDGKIAVFPMFAPNRRIEKRDDILKHLAEMYKVADVEDWSEYEAESFFLEGTGSMIIDHEHKIIYACLSPRTHKNILESFANAHHYKIVCFHSVDEQGVPVYHTNVIMHIGESYAVICLDSIRNELERIDVSQSLIATGHEIIPITQKQVLHFAGNMLQVKNKDGKLFTVMSKSAYDSLTKAQKHTMGIHTHLLPVDITTIETIGGGSARCMMAEIFLEKK